TRLDADAVFAAGPRGIDTPVEYGWVHDEILDGGSLVDRPGGARRAPRGVRRSGSRPVRACAEARDGVEQLARVPQGRAPPRGADRLAGMDLAVLSETALVDRAGEPHRLGDLWRDRPIVLVFLRHFG